MGMSKTFVSYFPVLGWFEIGASLLVAIGCAGELWMLFSNEPAEHDVEGKRIHRNRERIFMLMVALGVTIEVPCLMMGLRESAGLNKEAADLRLKMQPRIISDKQVKDFIFLTERIPKIPVRIDVGSGVFNQETCNFAYQIRELLEQAKFSAPDSDTNYSMRIFNDPSRIYISKAPPTDLIMFIESPPPNPINPQFGLLNPQFETVNGIRRPIAQVGNTNDILAALYYAFKDSGFSIGLNSKPEWTHDTHMEIFVREKP